MAKFNMAKMGLGNGLLNQYSQELKEGLEIVKIPLDQIEENELNNYSIENIDELVDSIRTVGLKQNLDVMKIDDQHFKILTGHRRYKALQILSAEDSKYSMVPCTVTELNQVKLPVSDESKEKYLIHITNSTQRDMTESDKYNQYQDLVSIYKEAQKNGFALSDKMRNLIAKDMKVSPAQVGKMDYIRNNGTDELKNRIQENEITIAAANEIAHHDKEVQATLKPKKERIIDTLDQDSYKLDTGIITPFIKSCSTFTKDFNKAASSCTELSKKDYARILESQKKIEAELEKMKKVINK